MIGVVFILYAVGFAFFFGGVLSLTTWPILVSALLGVAGLVLSLFCKKMPETRGEW